MKAIFKTLSALVMATVVSGISSHAQVYSSGDSVLWFTIDGGGNASGGGGFSLNGTVGQPDAAVLSGGNFTLHGGFWSGMVESNPRLRIFLASPAMPPNINARVTLAWPYPSTGFQLEAASAPVGAQWTTVPNAPGVVNGEFRVTLEAAGSARMFRLRAP